MTFTTTSAPPVDRRPRDLFGRRSIIGAIVVVAVLTFFGAGLRAIDENSKSTGFTPGQIYAVSDTLSFTPEAGWSIDTAGTLAGAVVTLTKDGLVMKVIGQDFTAGGQTMQDSATTFHDADGQDAGYTTVSDIGPFTTSTGTTGVTWTASGPAQAAQTWLVSDGTSGAYVPVTGPASNWTNSQQEIESMVESIVFASASSPTTT